MRNNNNNEIWAPNHYLRTISILRLKRAQNLPTEHSKQRTTVVIQNHTKSATKKTQSIIQLCD